MAAAVLVLVCKAIALALSQVCGRGISTHANLWQIPLWTEF